MQFKNFFEAAGHAKANRQKAESNLTLDRGGQFGPVDPALVKYFFDLQAKIEKEGEQSGGGMDYHIFARRMWEELVGEIDQQNEKLFHQFENALIFGLHSIDMKPLVYEHVTEQLAALIKQYKESIKHLALWSTGDVTVTGYQAGKINSSGIIKRFSKTLQAELPEGQVGEFMKEKTSYMVADNKFKAFTEYATEALRKNPDENLKIVIVEDSKKNFDKAREYLEKDLGEKATKVQIIPVWVTYSREGKLDEAKAISPDEKQKLEELKISLNSINDFGELLNTERFGDILKDAHLFVDFDGVIGSNIPMREEQAKVTYGALMQTAILSTGSTEQELVEKMKSRIK
jgi:hypothetical protein